MDFIINVVFGAEITMMPAKVAKPWASMILPHLLRQSPYYRYALLSAASYQFHQHAICLHLYYVLRQPSLAYTLLQASTMMEKLGSVERDYLHLLLGSFYNVASKLGIYFSEFTAVIISSASNIYFTTRTSLAAGVLYDRASTPSLAPTPSP